MDLQTEIGEVNIIDDFLTGFVVEQKLGVQQVYSRGRQLYFHLADINADSPLGLISDRLLKEIACVYFEQKKGNEIHYK